MFNPASMQITPEVMITTERFAELLHKEAQLELAKKMVASQTQYNNYADVSLLKIILDIDSEDKANG